MAIAEIPDSQMMDNQVKDPTKRRFLKTVPEVAIAAGAVATGFITASEIEKASSPSIELEHCEVWPLWEIHPVGISAEDLPPEIDLYFREFSSPHLTYSRPIDELLTAKIEKSSMPVIEKDIINAIKNRGAQLVYADVRCPEWTEELYDAKTQLESVGAHLAWVKVLQIVISEARKSMEPEGKNQPTRRTFLQKMAALSAAYFSLRKHSGTLNIDSHANQTTANSALSRILSRIDSLLATFDPTNANLLFRNAVAAHKILVDAEEYHQRTGEKANIVAQYGSAHGVMVDLLLAGKDICLKIIDTYPKEYLQETIQLTGGVSAFASSRCIQFDPKFDAEHNLNASDLQKLSTDTLTVDKDLFALASKIK